MEAISWETPIETRISWGKIPDEEGPKVYQHPKPVRAGNRILLEYVFRDSDGVIIPLTGLAYVEVYAKMEGGLAVHTLASFDADRSTGRVYVENFYFASEGIWWLQFFVYNGAVVARKGDPAKVKVAPNLDSITSSEELPY